MNILVIFTGGTIGSTVQGDWIDTSPDTKFTLINKYREATGDNETHFPFLSPYTILSENLSHKELNLLCECIRENTDKGYDGIIVAHGTDTLQYTSVALEFMFGDCDIPIIVVSANYPLENALSNGVDNFISAVSFIKSKIANGVFVSYKNPKSTYTKIHIPSRISAHSEASDEVTSINGEVFAISKDGFIETNGNCKIPTRITSVKARFCDNPDIMVITSYPNDSFIYPVEDCNAIILCPYHSGTLNTESHAFKAFCQKAHQNDIPIFLVNAYAKTAYKSTELFSSHNIRVLPFCTKISVYIKCWLAVSLGEDIKKFVETPLSCEFLD